MVCGISFCIYYKIICFYIEFFDDVVFGLVMVFKNDMFLCYFLKFFCLCMKFFLCLWSFEVFVILVLVIGVGVQVKLGIIFYLVMEKGFCFLVINGIYEFLGMYLCFFENVEFW